VFNVSFKLDSPQFHYRMEHQIKTMRACEHNPPGIGNL
jgi:hypothetical protein